MTAAALLTTIPHDGPALFVYALVVFCVVLVWRASRRPGGAPPAGRPAPEASSSKTPSRPRPR